MSISTQIADVNGTHLAYETAGSGEALVLIHGFGSDARVWDQQMEALARHHHVVRYDIRGHGRSALPLDGSYSHADDLKALLDHLGIHRAALIGQSMGGGIAIDCALAYPDAVQALVLVDSTLAGYTWSQEWDDSWAPVFGDAAANGMDHALPLLLAHPLFAASLQTPGVKERLAAIFADYSGWHITHDDPLVESAPPAIERLAEITAPTLVMLGAADLADFHRIATLLREGITGARFMALPGVGHLAPMETPASFNQIVLDFLAGL